MERREETKLGMCLKRADQLGKVEGGRVLRGMVFCFHPGVGAGRGCRETPLAQELPGRMWQSSVHSHCNAAREAKS